MACCRLCSLIVAAVLILVLTACAPAGPAPSDGSPVARAITSGTTPAPRLETQPPAMLPQRAEAETRTAGVTPAATAAPQSTAPAAPVSAPTAAPKVIPSAASPAGDSATVLLASLREEIIVAGAPSFAIIPRCTMPEDLLPGSLAATWAPTFDTGLLCLFGFGDNELVRYEVRDAGGEMAQTGEGAPDNMDGDPLPSVKVMLGIGDRAPGTWMVHALGTSGELSETFLVEPATLDGKPAIVLALAGGRTQFRLGESINVAAYGLPEDVEPPFGIYRVEDKAEDGMHLKLHEAALLQGDDGAAFVTLTLDPSYLPGEYCLLLPVAPEYEPVETLSELGATRCIEVTK